MKMNDRLRPDQQTPLTDEWLSEVDFKWRQDERQPNKHWKLIIQVASDEFRCWEPTAIELQRCGWVGGSGHYIGDPDKWMLWVTDRFDRTAYIRDICWQEEVRTLAEILSGRPWDPSTHLYGQAWPPGSKALAERAK